MGSAGVGQSISCSTGTWSNGPLNFGYQWLRNGVGIPGANQANYAVTVVDTARRLVCRVTATNPTASATADSAARSVPGGPGPGGGGAVVALSRESISPTAFRAAPKGPSALAAKLRTGATVSFTLSTAATVTFSVARPRTGRRSGKGGCVKPKRSNHRKRRCTRLEVLAGRFTRDGRAGANGFRFTGRFAGRKLKPGSYKLIATPSANGRTGTAVSASFHIIR